VHARVCARAHVCARACARARVCVCVRERENRHLLEFGEKVRFDYSEANSQESVCSEIDT